MINPHPVTRRRRGSSDIFDDNSQVLALGTENFVAVEFRCPIHKNDCFLAQVNTGETFCDLCCQQHISFEVKSIRRRGRWDKSRQKLISVICKTEKWEVKLGSSQGFYNVCLTSNVNLLILWYDYSSYRGRDIDDTNNTRGIYDQKFEYGLLLRNEDIVKYHKLGKESPIQFIDTGKKIIMHVLPEAFPVFQEVFPEKCRRSFSKKQQAFQKEVDAATGLTSFSELTHKNSKKLYKKKRKLEVKQRKKQAKKLYKLNVLKN
tara:strand:- start:625 stop:1407 length:783 start_codon:yes stop_codon:yes gene_type:complete